MPRLVATASMESYEWRRTYDAIWCRWVVGYLSDGQLEAFLKKAKAHLNP